MWLLDKDDNLKEKLIVESAIHSQVVNGLNTLEFECQNAIEKYDRIVYKNERGHWEEFIAQRVTDGRYSSNVYAEHSSYELYASYVGNRRPTESPSRHLEILLSETRWKVGNVEIGKVEHLSYYYIPVYTAIQNLCVKVEGEVQFRITVEDGKIKNRFVDILNSVGSNLGKRFTYTKDLESVTRTILDDEVYTALIGRGRGEEIEETGGFGRRIMFTDLDKVDSPKGTEYVFDIDALNMWGIEGGNVRRHRFGIVEFDDIEDKEELYQATKKKLQIVKEPRISYECSVILLGEPHENVSIGDVVAIIDKDFLGNEIRIKGRVIQLNKDLLNSNNSTVTIGNFVKSFVRETIALTDYINNFRSKSGIWDRSNAFDSNNQLPGSYIKDLLEAWNDNINQTGGFVYAELGKGIMTYDRPIDENPTKVTQLIGGSLRIANSKLSNGEWDWRTVLTGDGIAGQEILANSITVNKVSSDFGASLDISSNESLRLMVEKIPESNVIPNLNGSLDYFGWTFGVDNKGLKWGDLTRWFKYQTWNANFVPLEIHSLSMSGIKFVSQGVAISPESYIVPNSVYSFRARRWKGNQNFKVSVLEFDEAHNRLGKTSFIFEESNEFEIFTMQPAQMTMYIKLEFEVFDDLELILTEMMFNRGSPKQYQESPTDVRLLAQSLFSITDDKIESTVKEVSQLNDKVIINSTAITQLSTGISLVASKVDGVYGDIHNAGLEINAVEGVAVYGKRFSIWNESKTKEIFKINTIDGQEQVYMYGSIQSEGGEIAFDSERKEIKIGDTKLRSTSSAGMLLIKGNAINLDSDTSGVAYGLSFKGTPAIVKFSSGATTGYLDNIIPRTNVLKISSQSRLQLDNPSFEVDMNQDTERLTFLNKSQGGTLKGVFLEKWGNLLAYNGANLGWVDYRYGNLYLINQPNVSSDRGLKYNITDIDELLLDSFEPLTEKSFKTKHDDMHSFGYIAQDVEDCLYDFIRKVWDEDEVERQMDLFKILSREGEFMSLLYAEVQVIVSAVLRRQNKRLEERLERLEELYANSK